MIKTANVLTDIKTYDNHKFNTIFCDPPYQLGTKWIIGKDGAYKVKGKPKDFMNRWNGLDELFLDTFFNEANRVLKHGGYLLMFGLDRQLGALQYYALKNGFEIQQSLYWYFISNFPKATDASKAIVKRVKANRKTIGLEKKWGLNASGARANQSNNDYQPSVPGAIKYIPVTVPSTLLANTFSGYKYSIAPLKQTCETILVFKKPCKYNSVLNDLMECQKDITISPAVFNIEDSRIPFRSDFDFNEVATKNQHQNFNNGIRANSIYGIDERDRENYNEVGRFPAQTFVDSSTSERIDLQSGISKSTIDKNLNSNPTSSLFINGKHLRISRGDSGGASRILHQCNYEKEEYDLFLYHPKVSKGERNAGLTDFEIKDSVRLPFRSSELENSQLATDCTKTHKKARSENNHPTVKPINLIYRIAQLFKLPELCNQQWYIPFCGVGSEIIGIHKAGIPLSNIYGCEINPEYEAIREARIKYWSNEFILLNKSVSCKAA